MNTITLHEGDNRESLRRLIDQGVRVHSVVTDPPYGLVSIQKRFGKEGAKGARTEGNDGSFSRLSGGFMGKAWDATGIERDPEFWKLIWEILLPGGYVFAFSGSRTGHWQACAMEMAGFVMHPMHGWVFGSGFPKAHNAQRALGDAPEAADWAGWGYGTQAQKPALEPIYLGQKPFSEKTGAANLLKHGVGAVNIDGCRVGDGGQWKWSTPRGDALKFGGESARMSAADEIGVETANTQGRHPANLILDGSPEVAVMFPNESDRFFHQFAPDADPLFYSSKAGKADRAGSKHPTVKPIALMQYLIRHITPPGGTVLDPFAGSGTTAEAARREGFDCILMEAEPEYIDFLKQRFEIDADDDDDLLGSYSTKSTLDPELEDLL